MSRSFGPSYYDYARRLSNILGTDEDALDRYGEDLERDSENGVLSADEQDKLVVKFLLKLVATPHSSGAFISRR